MIDFHTPSLEDKEWINRKIEETGCRSCEYTFGNIFAYSAKMDIKVAEYEGCLVTRCVYGDELMYCYPMGNGDKKAAVEAIIRDSEAFSSDFVIFGMASEFADELESLFPDRFKITFDRNGSDYIYNSDDLINLIGKKYQPKRNHISFFKKNYNWSYEKITADNFSECIAMNEKWIEESLYENKDELIEELEIIKLVFENYDALDFVGGLIRVDGEVVAYTMGERMNEDTFCVHFEKAFSKYRGAYPMINREFCENELSAYKYVDREDDLGIDNLRKAKLSYYPAIIREEYEAMLKC